MALNAQAHPVLKMGWHHLCQVDRFFRAYRGSQNTKCQRHCYCSGCLFRDLQCPLKRSAPTHSKNDHNHCQSHIYKAIIKVELGSALFHVQYIKRPDLCEMGFWIVHFVSIRDMHVDHLSRLSIFQSHLIECWILYGFLMASMCLCKPPRA